MAERRDHIARNDAGSNPACPAYIRIRPGRVSLPLSRRLRGSQPCGCTSPETGNDLLSLSISPAEAGHMVGVAQLEERRSAKPCQPRVRIPPRPPGRIRCAGCQKWESPNLSSADSMETQPAGIEPCPAVIWDSSSVVESLHRRTQRSPVRFRPVPPMREENGIFMRW